MTKNAKFPKRIQPISDHALMRYSERVLGFDLELIRKQILRCLPTKNISNLMDGIYPLEIGGRAVVENHRVVTILK